MDLQKIIIEVNKFLNDNRGTVIKLTDESHIKNKIDMDLNKKFSNDKEFIDNCNRIIEYSVHTHKLYFLNQLYTGVDVYNVIADLLISILNTSMYTYEVAPVFNCMEDSIFNRIKVLFNQSDIILVPGASMANMYAMHLARFNYDKEINKTGLYKIPNEFKIFVSEQSHYSFEKGAIFMGFGLNSIVKIKSVSTGEMDTYDLVNKIINCKGIPLLIVATSGTTVLGAFDNIANISVIAKQYNMWLHIDAAYGGSVIYSMSNKHLLNGIYDGDSITWNPHKALRVSLQCSLFMTKSKDILKNALGTSAEYLFSEKPYDSSFDTGDKYLQCGRKVDILKLWSAYKTRGENEFGLDIDVCFNLSKLFASKVDSHPNFKLVMHPISTNVCFWWIKKNVIYEPNDLNKLTLEIKKKMLFKGEMMISFQPLSCWKLENFFRIVFIKSELTPNDLDQIIKNINDIGLEITDGDNIELETTDGDNIELETTDGKVEFPLNSIHQSTEHIHYT